MHCARWVLSCLPLLFIEETRMYICLPPLFMEERRTYICPPFCGTANEQDHCLILWHVRSLYHTGLVQDFLYPQPTARYRKKCCHGKGVAEKLIISNVCRGLKCKEPQERFLSPRNIKQHLLPGIAKKLISSNLCRGVESKEPIKIFLIPRNRKSVAMATLVARYC